MKIFNLKIQKSRDNLLFCIFRLKKQPKMINFSTSCIKVSDTQICPFCYSNKIVKNGHTKTKKQQFFCKKCRCRFLDYYSYKAYHHRINNYIVEFIKEGLGIRSISRVLKHIYHNFTKKNSLDCSKNQTSNINLWKKI